MRGMVLRAAPLMDNQMRHWILPLSRMPASYRMPARPTLRAVVNILRHEWRIVAVSALVAVLIGGVYCTVTPKLYEASVQVVPGDFTTRSTSAAAAGLASILLNAPAQSDSVKRFLTVLYSPDLAYRLVAQNRDQVLKTSPGWFSRLLGGAPQNITDPVQRVRRFQGALTSIQFELDKNTLATRFAYRSTSPQVAHDFLKLAVKQADELLRQYNLSEVHYDDQFLNRVIGTAQNVDVRFSLAQKIVETQLRRMDAERSEYFSIRLLGPTQISDGPVWPRTKLILVGMLILGALVGVVIALAGVHTRNRDPLDGQF